MISTLRFLSVPAGDPCRNLALEKCLTLGVRQGECLLFLWQDPDTVVLGRNQNAWAECAPARLREGRGSVVRRLSGGGAVYHDLGNLNFTFASLREEDDSARQIETVLRAVRSLGVPADVRGRNDLEAEGRKFSGTASYETGGRLCRHGTLMIDVDLDRLRAALTPPPAKLRSRGVASVRSRVVNLKEYCPALTRPLLEERLRASFEEVFGLRADVLPKDRIDEAAVMRETENMASADWILGRRIPFTAAMEGRFPWGGIRLELLVRHGQVADAAAFSDAMDPAFVPEMASCLIACPYDGEEMARRVREAARGRGGLREDMARDTAGLILAETGNAGKLR